MKPQEYGTMFAVEDTHWWYVGLRELVLEHVRRLTAGMSRPVRVLDVGCGTGKLLEALQTVAGLSVAGVDLSAEALRLASQREVPALCRASAAALPYADASFDLLTAMDVLYTIPSPADVRAVEEMSRVLRPGGSLLVHLPAYNFLRSSHDDAVHTQRRYRAGDVRGCLQQAGFRVTTATYRNTLLFPIAACVRLARRAWRNGPAAETRSDLHLPSRAVNRVLLGALQCENHVLRRGGELPFGLSIFSVATKP